MRSTSAAILVPTKVGSLLLVRATAPTTGRILVIKPSNNAPTTAANTAATKTATLPTIAVTKMTTVCSSFYPGATQQQQSSRSEVQHKRQAPQVTPLKATNPKRKIPPNHPRRKKTKMNPHHPRPKTKTPRPTLLKSHDPPTPLSPETQQQPSTPTHHPSSSPSPLPPPL